MAVLDLTDVMGIPVKDRTEFKPLDRFPGSDFDVTVVTPADAHASRIVDVVRNMGVTEIRSVGVLDVFDMGDGRKALTLHVQFRDSRKPLDADFLKETENRIISVLDEAGYPLRN